MRSRQGFSFIEMLVVFLVLAILVIALVGAYNSYTIRANRSDAVKSLSQMQINEEKWRNANTSYGTGPHIWGSTNSLSGYYTVDVTTNTTSGYTLTAVPTGSQASDADCQLFTLANTSGTTTLSSSPSSSCWQ